MFIFYDLLFLIFAVIYLPVYLFKRKFHPGFLARLGIFPEGVELNRPVWIHAVSVGEAMAVKGLIERIRESFPDKKLIISTVTPTGNRIVKSIAKETDFVTYLPLDLSFIVKKVIDRIDPSLFIIAETELWPNLIYRLHKNNIPVIVVNARISDKSFRGYSAVKFLIKQTLNKIDLFCVQTESDAQRFFCLGAPKDKIKVSGNLKFDNTGYADSKKDYKDYKEKAGVSAKNRLFVAGSTHPGEEEIILSVHKELLNEFPQLKLLIAPRHPQRADEVTKIAIKYGFDSLKISRLTDLNRQTGFGIIPSIFEGPADRQAIYILDTVGQLMGYYAASDIVFVGGSLVKKGGHNILEPASLGKPVIFGPYMFNFRDIFDLFISHKACVLVYSKEGLKAAVRDLLNNPDKMDELGKRASSLIKKNQGATENTLRYIKEVPLPA